MKYIYDTRTLAVYQSQEHKSALEMANICGISNSSMTRYIKSERDPDFSTLITICNSLRVSIHNFIHSAEEIVSKVKVYSEEEYKPIRFCFESIEKIREDNGLDKKQFVLQLQKECHTTLSMPAYYRLINGQVLNPEYIIAILNTFNVSIDELFSGDINGAQDETPTDILISLKALDEMKERIKELEEENREITRRFRNEQRKARASVAVVKNDDHGKAIRQYILRAEKLMDELRALLPEHCEIRQR